MGKGKACFTQHNVARRRQMLLRGAGSTHPCDEQHRSCRQNQALSGVHLQLSPSQLLQGKGLGKSKHPTTSHLWHHITPDHHCRHTGVLKWRIHNMQHVRFQSLAVLRCLSSLYNFKTNVFLNMATKPDRSVTTKYIKEERDQISKASNSSPKGIIQKKVNSILQEIVNSYCFCVITSSF